VLDGFTLLSSNPLSTHVSSFCGCRDESSTAQHCPNAQYVFVSMNAWSCTVPLLSLSVSCRWRIQNICSVFVLLRQNPSWWSLVFSAAYDLLLPWYSSRCNDQAADWKPWNRGSILRWDKRHFHFHSFQLSSMPTQPPVQSQHGVLPPGLKHPERQAHHSHLGPRLRMSGTTLLPFGTSPCTVFLWICSKVDPIRGHENTEG
jgi:hypothetical protein